MMHIVIEITENCSQSKIQHLNQNINAQTRV